jgi:hypothetical protein
MAKRKPKYRVQRWHEIGPISTAPVVVATSKTTFGHICIHESEKGYQARFSLFPHEGEEVHSADVEAEDLKGAREYVEGNIDSIVRSRMVA